jgi:hypothetical protein
MRKIVSIFFIFTGSALLLISSSDRFMKMIATKRSGIDGWFGIHRSNAGDLVSMSYLDSVKQFLKKYKENFARPPDDSGKRNIDLYIYGDSYLLSIPDSAFGYINSYHFGRRSYFDLNYSLDYHKKNILIIEIAERFVRTEFQLHQIYLHLKKKEPGSVFLRLSSHPAIYAGLPDIQFFSPDINRNLEFNLFGYRFWDQVKLAKASLTYDLFKRAVGDAVVSDDGSRLFLKQTMARKDVLSSYYPFDQTELQVMISNINDVYDHYKAEGFDEIYLSVIPNPVTVLQPLYYNGLIPQLQNPDSLKGMQIIDMYSLFMRDPDPGRLYRIGDTHWSFDGIQVWLNEVNAELKKLALQTDSNRKD